MIIKLTQQDLQTEKCIATITGKLVDPFDLKDEDIDIVDIVYSLSNIIRWHGHSIAQFNGLKHSLLVTGEVIDILSRVKFLTEKEKDVITVQALLHDASDTYLSDLSPTIKHRLPDFKKLEDYIQKRIFERFKLPVTMPSYIKIADKRLAEEEWSYKIKGTVPEYLNEGKQSEEFKKIDRQLALDLFHRLTKYKFDK